MMVTRIRRLVFFLVGFFFLAGVHATEPRPPGLVLQEACAKFDSNGSSAEDRFDRAYCFRFIGGVMSVERMHAIERSIQPGDRSLMGHCYRYYPQAPVAASSIVEIARRLVKYLDGVYPPDLNAKSMSDDVQLRLFADFMRKQYPCSADAAR